VLRLSALALLAALSVQASAASPPSTQAFDPRAYHDRILGRPTQVLVLATPHLSGTPDGWNPMVLEPLLAKLEAFHPDAIAIEALPGRSISMLWQYRESFPDAAQFYAGRAMVLAALARNGVGLDMPDADAQSRKALASWPASPTPEQRRHLAALFAASGDPGSALVQWWRLDPTERVHDKSVPPLLAEQLATYDTPARRNEDYLIGARLAVRLGLERVYPIDDQSDDVASDFDADFSSFTSEPWYAALLQDPHFAVLSGARNHLNTPDEALATYRMLNAPAAGRADPELQWFSMISRPSPHNVGRQRVGAWETRNLRMAANIREVAARLPGKRVLVVVGSAHKPWLDSYLEMMTDVGIVDAGTVLR
jgi:hypothetical protein